MDYNTQHCTFAFLFLNEFLFGLINSHIFTFNVYRFVQKIKQNYNKNENNFHKYF